MPSDYKLINDEARVFKTGSRTDTAALLAWFMSAVWRAEPEEIDDAICDGTGDKGVDGLLVNEDLNEITVFQSKFRNKSTKTQGDAELKQLVGAAAYFESVQAIDGLLASTPNPELKRLLARLRIRERVADGMHAARLVFVTNGPLDAAGEDYISSISGREPPLEVWDRPKLASVAKRTRRPELLDDVVQLTASSTPSIDTLEGSQIAVGFVHAKQLVSLPGIEDLSLFARNVRLSEGRTRINRELGETVANPTEHAMFPAYHNGLTLLTHGLVVRGRTLKLDGIAVVNGCQSLITLHGHSDNLSDDLKVLVKVVEVERQRDIADKITYRTNNQNPVDLRDQRSTDVIQRDLQSQVGSDYSGKMSYAIKEGERFNGPILDNKTAAQFLMAVYVKEPWNAVRKVRLFDEDYRRIFNREVDSHRLYFVHLLSRVIDDVKDKLRPELAASFASVRLTLAYLVGEVARQSEAGRELVRNPSAWLPEKTEEVKNALLALAEEAVDSVNFYMESEEQDHGDEFDPKVSFKSRTGVRDIEREVMKQARRQARRDDEFLFGVAKKAAPTSGSKRKATPKAKAVSRNRGRTQSKTALYRRTKVRRGKPKR